MFGKCVPLASCGEVTLNNFQIDEEGNSNVARQFSVSSVPTVLFFRNGNEIGRVIGANPAQLMQQLEKIVKDNETIEQRLKSLVNQESVMIFIKGTPQEPRCKFTRAFIALLNQLEAKYGYFDILSDNEVRESLKLFSNWPTYPQLYVKGKLVGGLDIAQVCLPAYQSHF